VDWGRTDFTVITVMDIQTHAVVHCDRFNQLDFKTQRGRLMAICERYKPAAIVAEQNSIGEPIIQQLREDKLYVTPFLTTNASKARIIDQLALAFERGTITIFNDPILIGELMAFQATRLPSGAIRYAAPNGMHDDMCMSLALAEEACGHPDGVLEYYRHQAAKIAEEKALAELNGHPTMLKPPMLF
jgi:hypothetical protein